MDLKAYVLANVKPEDYYSRRFPQWKSKVRSNIKCVFHKDKSPSLALCLNNGGARCHAAGCGMSIANIIHFESTYHEISETIAARRIYADFIRKLVSKKEVARYIEALALDGLKLLKIKKEMGLNSSSIKRFSLGLDPATDRITIPIYDQFDNVVNIRFYRLPSERRKNEVKIYNLKGYGQNELFPRQAIEEYAIGAILHIMAGEKDTMLAIQNGLAAACGTSGEDGWEDSWNGLVSSRSVSILFDRDSGGVDAGKRLRQRLATVAKSVSIISLPFRQTRPDFKDFTDWILKEKHDVSELRVKDVGRNSTTPSFDSSRKEKIETEVVIYGPKLPPFYDRELHEIAEISSKSNLLNKRIRTQGIVAARSSNTFSIPWKFRIKPKQNPAFDHELPLGRTLLRFVRASDGAIEEIVANELGGNIVYAKPIEYITVTEVEIIPIAAVNRDVPYVVQRCFYFGESIKDNIPYYLEIIPASEIRTQETIGIITKHTPLSLSLEHFKLTLSLQKQFKEQFAPTNDQTVWDKLKELVDDLAINHTHIYNRTDWHIVALLSWASPIGWNFPDSSDVQRGWINSLALGDTQTGKSEVCKTFQRLLNCGVFVNAENCTYVGLVGGAIKVGNGQLMLRWGRIPLSDKQLVVLEELSGLSIDEISNMSDVRSSGIARLDKGGINSQTNSRTRLLCLSNVRSQHKNLSGYLYGVKAIQELVGHGEDIARFDLITTLVDREVDVATINKKHFATVAKTDTNLLQQLIHYIWSLSPSDIEFSKQAYECCLEETKKLASEYHSSIPIFKGGSGRYKLARIAAAIACLQFSYDQSKRVVLIKRVHVNAAARLLRHIYDKPSFGYREYSAREFDRDTLKDLASTKQVFETRIESHKRKAVIECLIHSTQFSMNEFRAIASCSMLYAEQIIGYLLRSRIIRKGQGDLWEITQPGKLWLEKQLK